MNFFSLNQRWIKENFKFVKIKKIFKIFTRSKFLFL